MKAMSIKIKLGFLLLLVLTSGVSEAQTFMRTTSDNLAGRSSNYFNAKTWISELYVVDVDHKALLNEVIELEINGKSVSFPKEKLNVRGIKNFSWIGSTSNRENQIILVSLDDNLQGWISIGGTEQYMIDTDAGKYYIYRVDYSKIPADGCETSCIHESHNQDSFHEQLIPTNYANPQLPTVPTKMITNEPFTCRLRLMVVYTPVAQEMSSDIVNLVQLSVDQLNLSFVNSEIFGEAELVYVGLVDYTEQATNDDQFADVNAIQNPWDGEMDEIHLLRYTHQADMVALMCATPSAFIGKVYLLKASHDNAFCTVNPNFSTLDFTFSHEIGHLIGCNHHNPAVNGIVGNANTFPIYYDLESGNFQAASAYPINHGWRHPQRFANNDPFADWKTIMTTQPLSTPRILFWSNPNLLFNGVPMGTNTYNNNALMINNMFPNIMSLKQPDNDLYVSQANIESSHAGDIIANNLVASFNEIEVNADQSYSFRSGNIVDLNPGFDAVYGAEFVTEIIDVQDCGEPDNGLGDFEVRTAYVENSTLSGLIYPNPTKGLLQYHLPEKFILTHFKIEVYNILGEVCHFELGTSEKGELDLSKLTDGTYFIAFHGKESVVTYKIVKL